MHITNSYCRDKVMWRGLELRGVDTGSQKLNCFGTYLLKSHHVCAGFIPQTEKNDRASKLRPDSRGYAGQERYHKSSIFNLLPATPLCHRQNLP